MFSSNQLFFVGISSKISDSEEEKTNFIISENENDIQELTRTLISQVSVKTNLCNNIYFPEDEETYEVILERAAQIDGILIFELEKDEKISEYEGDQYKDLTQPIVIFNLDYFRNKFCVLPKKGEKEFDLTEALENLLKNFVYRDETTPSDFISVFDNLLFYNFCKKS